MRSASSCQYRKTGRPPRRGYRPLVEALEDRLTPSVTITTTADVVNAGDGVLSLREAISQVNAGTVADNTVMVPAGIYKITLAGVEDANAAGDFDITHTLILRGAGASATVIDGNGLDRVFHVRAVSTISVTFSALTIQGGKVTGHGGAIATNGDLTNIATLTINGVVVSGNTATGHGGGINCDPGNFGDTTITNSVLRDNIAGFSGGGLAHHGNSSVAIANSTITGNFAYLNGGAWDNDTNNRLDLTSVTIAGNTALFDGGAINMSSIGSVNLFRCIVSGNSPSPGQARHLAGGRSG
jgi:predicted outer membrane repeat protein